MSLSRVMILCNLAVVTLFVGMLAAAPIALDTEHFDDTVLLAHLGWRGVNGLFPVVDYPHYWGGLVSWFITWAFQIFGVSFQVINYAFVLMFGASAAILVGLSWRRLSPSGLTLLLALSAALILSLAPIETGTIYWPRAAHSFVYNHVAIVLMMALTVFALIPIARSRWLELVGAIVAGVGLYMLILLKATFAIFAPFFLLAIVIHGRWLTSMLVLVGAMATMVLIDPGLVRVRGSLEVMLSSSAAESLLNARAIIARYMSSLAPHSLPILLVVILLAARLWHVGRSALPMVIGSVLCVTGYCGTLISMGGEHTYQLLPALVVVALALTDTLPVAGAWYSDRTRRQDNTAATLEPRNAIPYAMSYALVLPSLMSAVVAFGGAFSHRSAVLVSDGPAASYVVRGDGVGQSADLVRSVDLANTAIEEILSSGRSSIHFGDAIEYIMFADGIELLRQVPDVRQFGIVSNGRMFDFTTPLLAPPVRSFPVWPTTNLSYFTEASPFAEDVDLIMMARDVPELELIGTDMIRKMGTAFVSCRRSQLWTLYARRSLSERLCGD